MPRNVFGSDEGREKWKKAKDKSMEQKKKYFSFSSTFQFLKISGDLVYGIWYTSYRLNN